MARQPKTRQPKAKFTEKHRLRCHDCKQPTSSFDIKTRNGKPVVLCKGCSTDTYTV